MKENRLEGVAINQSKMDRYLENLKTEQNLSYAIIAGITSCILGAAIWALVTVSTGYQIGYMAIGVGFLVGFSIKLAGKGIDQMYGIMGAFFALLGCLLGNFFSQIGFASESYGTSFMEILGSFDYSLLPEMFMETFSPMDLLFYGFALYEGYKFSFRTITEEEILEYAVDKQPAQA